MFFLNEDNQYVTVELRDIVASGVKVFDFEYPVPAETVTYNGKTAPVPFDKTALEKKILDHYWTRQLGHETVGRWLHHFRARMCEIMPYYSQLYELEAKWHNIEDPLESYNLTETIDGTHSTTGNATGTTNNTRKFSDTPQGSISNLETHLTEGEKNDGGSTENRNETGSNKQTLTRRGNIGVQPLGYEVNILRQAIINIDQMIINDLAPLFLGVY